MGSATNPLACSYGGTDYLPRMLPLYSERMLERGDMLILVHSAPHSDPHSDDPHSDPGSAPAVEGDLNGIICGDLRGSCVFILGLRVSSKYRGQGIAKKLLVR